MLLGSFKGAVCVCDVWRTTVFASYKRHDKRIQEVSWTNFPKCLGCSVSMDGTARLYAFE